MVTLELPMPEVLEKLSFLVSSGQREKVLGAVYVSPRSPAQIAKETGLRLPHVSRTLRQLSSAGLVRPLSGEPRGRLYSTTRLGQEVFDQLGLTRGDRVVAPMCRGMHYRSYYHWVTLHFGKKRADALFQEFGIDPSRIDPEGWYPLRTALQIMETIEALFGDGTYETVRQMFEDEAGSFSSVQRLLRRVLPLSLLLEMVPSVYSREFNHGRVEVEVHGRRGLMKHFDWVSSPGRCAAWQGVYQGGLRLSGHRGKVTKVACMLKGDPYCGYVIEW